MDLRSRLVGIAEVWVSQWQRTDESTSLRTLGRKAVGNALLFERGDMNVSTADRLVAFLAEPASWPAGLVPRETADEISVLTGRAFPLAHVIPVAA